MCGGFTFDAAPVHPLLAKLPWCLILKRQEIAEYPRLELVIRLIATELDASSAPTDDTKLLLLESLFHYAFMCWAQRDSRSEGWNAIFQDPRLVRALGLLFAAPGHWDANTIASECGLSRSAFRSLFRATVGERSGRYLSRLRVDQAKELLKSSSLSLHEIAEKVGSADPFSLSKAFKRFQGCFPRQYRQQTSETQGMLRTRRPAALHSHLPIHASWVCCRAPAETHRARRQIPSLTTDVRAKFTCEPA
jgi:AraC-like DNA-binding protein